ncbi:MAG: hypothetical protein ER33_11910 [Cyanobium sp. CACIAM 14]|nr:MAG: hypothetical protein ER33_11910 [Cyanobium sp. CACIAM 14]
MSLVELVTGTVVFVLAAGSSLQIWALATSGTLAQERLQRRLEDADASLLRAEAVLRRLAPSGGDCAEAAVRLLQALANEPVAPSLERQLQTSAAGDGVVLQLMVEGMAEPRVRLFLPAALGLCGPPAASPE